MAANSQQYHKDIYTIEATITSITFGGSSFEGLTGTLLTATETTERKSIYAVNRKFWCLYASYHPEYGFQLKQLQTLKVKTLPVSFLRIITWLVAEKKSRMLAKHNKKNR